MTERGITSEVQWTVGWYNIFFSNGQLWGKHQEKKTSWKTVLSSLQAGKEIWPSKYRHLQSTLAEAVQLFKQADTTERLSQNIPFCNDRSTKGQGVIWPFLPPPWTWQRGFLSLSRSYLAGYKLCWALRMQLSPLGWAVCLSHSLTHGVRHEIHAVAEQRDVDILL